MISSAEKDELLFKLLADGLKYDPVKSKKLPVIKLLLARGFALSGRDYGDFNLLTITNAGALFADSGGYEGEENRRLEAEAQAALDKKREDRRKLWTIIISGIGVTATIVTGILKLASCKLLSVFFGSGH